jgi:hypothetical protein
MKKLLLIAVFLFTIPSIAVSTERVKGYWRDFDGDGVKDTYIDSYERTSPNKTKTDNYNYPGNYNPNTGKTSTGSTDKYDDNSYYKSKKKKSLY